MMIYDEERYMPQEPTLTLREEELMNQVEDLHETMDDLCLQIENTEIDYYEVVNENEHLKAQVYNLTMYLKVLWDNCNTAEMKGHARKLFDGMPGYGELTQEILKGEEV